MLKTFDLRGREKPLDVFGPPGTQRLLASLSGVWGRVAYDLQITDIDAGDAIEFDGYEVEAFNVRHRGRSFGYALVEHERPGRFDPERARGARRRARARRSGACRRGRPSAGVSPEQVIGEARPGRRVVLSGDTAPCDMVRESARGADVLVHEATFLDEDAGRAAETDHSTARQAAEVAREAGRRAARAHAPLEPLPAAARARGGAGGVPSRVHVARDFDAVEVPQTEKGPPRVVPWDRAARFPADGQSPAAELL